LPIETPLFLLIEDLKLPSASDLQSLCCLWNSISEASFFRSPSSSRDKRFMYRSVLAVRDFLFKDPSLCRDTDSVSSLLNRDNGELAEKSPSSELESAL
jgi:hypothetical protein